MNLRSLAARATVASAVTALAAAGLVGAVSTSANAAETSGDYTCALPVLGDQTFPLSLSVPLLPPTAPAGFPVGPGLLSYTSGITVPATAAGLLGQLSVDGGTISDFAMHIGDTVVPAPGTYTANAPGGDGSVLMDGAGSNDAFTLPGAGTYDVKMPSAFTFGPTVAGVPLDLGAGPVTIACVTDAPATLGQVVLSKQASTVVAKDAKAKAGKAVKVPVTVTPEYTLVPTGKVIAKEGSKKVGTGVLKDGKTVVNVSKLKAGKHTITLVYGGDKNTNSSTKDIVITAKKKK